MKFPEKYDNEDYFKVKYFNGITGELIGYEVYTIPVGHFMHKDTRL